MKKTSQRIAIVTGGNKGIGFEICRTISLRPDWLCILGSRSAERGKAAAKKLIEGGAKNVRFAQLDIGSTVSVKSFVSTIAEEFGRVDVLVNNAAIAFKGSDPTPFRAQAKPTLATNLFATVAFTKAVLPLLLRSSSPRVVNVASQAGSGAISRMSRERQLQLMSPNANEKEILDLGREFISDVESGKHKERGWPNTCYGTSKALVIAWTRHLSRVHKADAKMPSAACCCPGYCATDMSSHKGPRSAAKGAETPAWLALRDEELSGRFYYDKRVIPLDQYEGTGARDGR